MSPKALDEPTPLSAKVSLTIGRRLVLYVYLVTSLFFLLQNHVSTHGFFQTIYSQQAPGDP